MAPKKAGGMWHLRIAEAPPPHHHNRLDNPQNRKPKNQKKKKTQDLCAFNACPGGGGRVYNVALRAWLPLQTDSAYPTSRQLYEAYLNIMPNRTEPNRTKFDSSCLDFSWVESTLWAVIHDHCEALWCGGAIFDSQSRLWFAKKTF